jgi:competence protein ComEC
MFLIKRRAIVRTRNLKLKEILQAQGPPTLRLAAGFVAGAISVQQWPALPGAWVLLGLVLLLAAAIHWRWTVFAAFAFGLFWASGYAAWHLRDALPIATERQQALVEGTVLTIPRRMERGVRFDFGIDTVLEPMGLKLPAKVRLSWYDGAAAPKAGERWRLRVSLRRPRGMLNPGGFDYEQWLFAQGIRALGYVRGTADHRRIGDAPALSIRAWRQAVYGRLAETLAGSPTAGLIEALTLGVDDDITPAQWEVLRRTGTAHLIAISGSHIGLIAGFAFFLARGICTRLGVLRWPPPRVAALAAFAAALLYSALADFAIPTRRAMIMIGVAMGAVAFQRNLHLPHVLALAVLAVVLHDPLTVLAPGFWLSFGAVALIAFAVSGRVERTTGGRAPVRNDGEAPPDPAQALPRFFWRFFRTLLKINGVTALGLAPLLLLFFRQVSLVSPLANLLAVPVLGTLLIPVCLSGALLLPVVPAAGAGLLHLAEFILSGTWPVLEWLSARPLAQWTHAEPPSWTLPFALLGAVLILAPRGIPARWLGLVLLLPAAAFAPERPAPGEFRLVLLDVGQGLASVVETRHRVLVFDTGARFGPGFDMGGAVIEPYLRQRGLGRIDTLVVSHGDLDHIGGARSLLARFPVGLAYTSVPERLREFPTSACSAGQRWTWDGVSFEMLGPVEKSAKENDNSCVLRVRGQSGSALLTADIEQAAEARLVERYGGRLRSDVLVVPHHGSKTSSTPAFLEAVSPRYALIPAGYLNRFGFPHRTVLRRYAELGAAVLNTAEAGAIIVAPGNGMEGLHLSSYRREYRRYWHEP